MPIVQLSEEEIARLIQALGKVLADRNDPSDKERDQALMDKLFKIRASD